VSDEDGAVDTEAGEEGDKVCCNAFESIVFPWSGGFGFTVSGRGGDDDSVTGFDESGDLISPAVPNLSRYLGTTSGGITSGKPWTRTTGGLDDGFEGR
jgi:hypothetical protein